MMVRRNPYCTECMLNKIVTETDANSFVLLNQF